MVPTKWTITRREVLPIVEVTGECSEKSAESVMITMAMALMDIAYEYKGVPTYRLPLTTSNVPISIAFSLQFPTEKELENFVKATKP